MVRTRPDIAQAVGVVSRYISNPGQKQWIAVKWDLRYPKGSLDMTLCCEGTNIRLHRYMILTLQVMQIVRGVLLVMSSREQWSKKRGVEAAGNICLVYERS